jgi:hydrocephalus-inducing protein
VGYRPLLVSASEATLQIESPELGLFEWGLKLAGLSTNPERSLTFNVPLGSRETQVGQGGRVKVRQFRLEGSGAVELDHPNRPQPPPTDLPQVFRWLDDKADYKCSFKGGENGASAFECAPVAAAPPGGASGSEVSFEVNFEPEP